MEKLESKLYRTDCPLDLEELRTIMLTKDAGLCFETDPDCFHSDYGAVPKDEYFENGVGINEIFQLSDKDLVLTMDLYGRYDKTKNKIVPVVYYNVLKIISYEGMDFVDVENLSEIREDTTEYDVAVDYTQNDWVQQIEKKMKTLLATWCERHNYV
jgi:hypothetical protein